MKKFWIVLAVLILPITMLLSSCGGNESSGGGKSSSTGGTNSSGGGTNQPTPTGFQVYIDDQIYSSTNNVIEITHGTAVRIDDEIVVKVTYSDNTSKTIDSGAGGYDITGAPAEWHTNTYGYEIGITYGEYSAVTIKVIISPVKLTKPSGTQKLEFTGEELVFTPTDYDATTMVIHENAQTQVGEYEAIVDIIDKENFAWADGTTDIVKLPWSIVSTAPVVTVPTDLETVYGAKLSSVTLPTHTEGTWTWDTPTDDVGEAGYRAHKATFTPTDTKYKATSHDVTIHVAPLKVTKPSGTKEAVFTSEVQTFTPVGYDDTTMNISNNVKTDANSYTAVVSLKNKDNYQWSDGTTEDVSLPWEIAKATPIYTVPTDITAPYGATLAEVDLPDRWSWKIETDIVGEIGMQEHIACFYPADTSNYSIPEVKLEVEVDVAKLAKPQTGNSIFNYDKGVKIYTPENFDEAKMNIANNIKTDAGEYSAAISLKDTTHYAWADGTSTSFNLDWKIAKAIPVYTVPEDQKATWGDLVSSVTLPTGWAWSNPADTVGSAGGTNNHEVIFTPADTDNYNVYSTYIKIEVSPLKLAVPTFSGTYTYNGSEQTVTIDGFDETYMKKVGSLNGTNSGNYTIIFSLISPGNCTWADGTTSSINQVWKINKVELTQPTVKGTYTYNKTEQTVELNDFDADKMTVINNKKTNVTDPTQVKVSIKEDYTNNYKFAGTTETNIYITWKINHLAVTAPTQSPSGFVYDGTEKEYFPSGFDSEVMKMVESYYKTNKGTGADTYYCQVNLIDNNYKWDEEEDQYGVRYFEWTIDKATPIYTVPTGIKAGFYDNLNDISLPVDDMGAWQWKTPSTNVGNVSGNKTFVAYYNVSGLYSDNYKHGEDVEVTVFVDKITPEYDAPLGLEATSGALLSTVSLGEETEEGVWSWAEPETSVGEAGHHWFKAIYTPKDTENYRIVEEYVVIYVTVAE